MPDQSVDAAASRAASPAAAPKPRGILARELRPMAQVRRIALVEREVLETLSQAALDAVFAHAEVISEGECSQDGASTTFLGSTMLTFDLAATAAILRELPDEATARRLGQLLLKEKTLETRIEAIARREVERLAARTPVKVHGETRIRIRGSRVFLDVDVEAML